MTSNADQNLCWSWVLSMENNVPGAERTVSARQGSCSHGIFPVIFDRGFWYIKERRFEGTSCRFRIIQRHSGSGVTCGDFH